MDANEQDVMPLWNAIRAKVDSGDVDAMRLMLETLCGKPEQPVEVEFVNSLTVQQRPQHDEATSRRRMSPEQVRLKAEAIIKVDGWPMRGKKPSRNRMAEKVGCSPSTLRKAIDESPGLVRSYNSALVVAGAKAGDSEVETLAQIQALTAEQEEDDRSQYA